MVVLSPQHAARLTNTLVFGADAAVSTRDAAVCPGNAAVCPGGTAVGPGDTATSPTDTVVCHCHSVTESVIRDSIDVLGATTVAEVTATTRAGSGCSGCHCRIRRMLAGKPAKCSLFDVCNACGFDTQLCECHAG
jgi:bacterioferritin-associated ferredoxin